MKLKTIGSIGIVVLILAIASCQTDEQMEFKRYYSAGSLVYQSHCQNCHGAHGEGLQGLIPPLTDTVYIKVNKAMLACIIKNGLKGKITISGKTFDGEMPTNDLTTINVAEVITYVANSFGNKTGTFNSQEVEMELKSCN